MVKTEQCFVKMFTVKMFRLVIFALVAAASHGKLNIHCDQLFYL